MRLFQVFGEFAIGVASAFAATWIAAIYVSRKGYLLDWWDSFLIMLRPARADSIGPIVDHARLRRSLREWLRNDQSRDGTHIGEFGQSSALAEAKAYNPKSTLENLSIKPRMYLTYWPVVVLSEHQVCRRQTALAIEGVRRLFVRNRIYLSLAEGTTPTRPPPMVVSFRHTMLGAWLLYRLFGWNSISRSVAAAMLDRQNRWQRSDGGWAQHAGESAGSDLWTATYALHLLDQVARAEALSSEARDLGAAMLKDTINYLERAWKEEGWKYSDSIEEENSVLILVEVAKILRSYRPNLLKTIVETMRKNWLGLSNGLRDTYIEAVRAELTRRDRPDTSESALSARFAYALYMAEEDVEVWYPLFLRSVEKVDTKMNSADIAFIMDMSYVAQRNGR